MVVVVAVVMVVLVVAWLGFGSGGGGVWMNVHALPSLGSSRNSQEAAS